VGVCARAIYGMYMGGERERQRSGEGQIISGEPAVALAPPRAFHEVAQPPPAQHTH
jgi:hypothetical protein